MAALVAGSIVVAGCAGDGTDLTAPGQDGATAPPIVVAEEELLSSPPELTDGFDLTSPAFDPGAAIPPVFTRRDGDNLSPPIAWTNVPAEAVELALVMTDPSADGFVHWVIWGLDPLTVGVARGQVPPGALQASNGFGILGYTGPDPPLEDDAHVYLWRLFALDSTGSDLPDGMDGRAAITELEGRAIAIAELIAFYG